MRQKIDWNWERLDNSTWRAKILGGWLVKSEFTNNKSASVSIAFVPDRDHGWMINKPKPEFEEISETVFE